MGLNYLANKLGLEFDDSGENAKKGKLDLVLLDELNQLNFYELLPPKSLGIEWFEMYCLPLIDNENISIQDRLHTFSHHIATQISIVLKGIKGDKILITGGGAYNNYVIDLLTTKTRKKNY